MEEERGEYRVFLETFAEHIGLKWLRRYLPPRNLSLMSLCYTQSGHGSGQFICCFLWHSFHMCLWFEEDCPAAVRHLGDSPVEEHVSRIKTLDHILSNYCSFGDSACCFIAFVFFSHFLPSQ